jgi:hypothetical protein
MVPIRYVTECDDRVRVTRRVGCWALAGAGVVLVAVSGQNLRDLLWLDNLGTCAVGAGTCGLLVPWVARSFRRASIRSRSAQPTAVADADNLAALEERVRRNEERLAAYDQAWTILGQQEEEQLRAGDELGRLRLLRGGRDDTSQPALARRSSSRRSPSSRAARA